MNKKQETAIGIAVAAISLVYQVAYGTNEESYMYGYKAALFASHCLVVSARTNNGDDCERAYISPQWGCGEETLMTQGYKQTNVTACNDGFINGFGAILMLRIVNI